MPICPGEGFKVNGPSTGSDHCSQLSCMEVATDTIAQAIATVKRDPSIRAIDARPCALCG